MAFFARVGWMGLLIVSLADHSSEWWVVSDNKTCTAVFCFCQLMEGGFLLSAKRRESETGKRRKGGKGISQVWSGPESTGSVDAELGLFSQEDWFSVLCSLALPEFLSVR